MTEINRQKFIAELTKLLTFMFEEDQHLVLAMYNSLFDDAVDEAALIEFFNSPTRQAVALARSYNAKMRKLHVQSTSRAEADYEEDEDEIPAFVSVLEQLREDAEDRGLVGYGEPITQSIWGQSRKVENLEQPQIVAETKEEVKPVEPPKEPAVQENAGTEPEKPVEAETVVIPEQPEEKKAIEAAVLEETSPALPDLDENFFLPTGAPSTVDEANEPTQKERKVIVPLAILYAIIAVPLAIVITVALLVPTFAALGASGVCIYAGVKTLLAAFAGFSMFSDIMVVLGCGLVIVSLGLLFLWIFVWFVGSAIAGVINGFIGLGNKWCSREVQS